MTNFYRYFSTTVLCLGGLAIVASAAEPIEVGRNAAVKGTVEIQSLSTFTVGPQCDIVIDKFVYDPKKNNNTLSAKVKKGMFRFTSGKVSKTNPDKITVETPTATMGIRGTMVEATLVILRGPGENNTSNNRRGEVDISSGGRTVTLTESGTGVLVSNADQKPSEPFVVSESLFNYFNRRLRTKPSREGNYRPFIIDDNWFTPIEEEEEQPEFLTPLESIEDTDWPSRLSGGIDIDTQ